MNSKLAQDLVSTLTKGNDARPSITVKVPGDIVFILEKYRSATTTKDGGGGKLESYSDTVGKLVKCAHECITDMAKQKSGKEA